MRDLITALRRLAHSPGYSLSALAVLALGTCLAIAVVAVISASLFTRPRIPERSRFVRLYTGETSGAGALGRTSLPDYRDLQSLTADVFDGLAFSANFPVIAGDPDGVDSVSASFVSGNYFGIVQPPLSAGRGIDFEDTESRASVVVVSHRFWRAHMDGTGQPLGIEITLGGHPFRVVGVAASGFRGMEPASTTELWLPYPAQGAATQSDYILENRDAYVGAVFGRLHHAVTFPQAALRVHQAATTLSQNSPAFNEFRSASLATLEATFVAPASTRYTLFLSLAVVLFVHLIVCSNLSTLVSVRAHQRRRDSAIRLALGASPRRMLWELMLEPLLITVAATGLALLCLPSMIGWLASQPWLRGLDLRLDSTVLLFAVGLSALTALLIGALPASRASTASIRLAFSFTESTPARAGQADHLVTLQVALALTVVYVFALVSDSLETLRSIETGYDTSHLVFAHLSQAKDDSRVPEWKALYESVLQEVTQIPGVEAASTAQDLPLHGWAMRSPITVPGYSYGSTEPHDVNFDNVGPNYFRTMGISIVRGREFDLQDPITPPHALSQVIVNQAFATRYWPSQDPVGKTLLLGRRATTVIGVVADARFLRLADSPEPRYFVSLLQPAFELVVRTSGDPAAIIPSLRTVLSRHAPLLEAPAIRTVANAAELSLSPLTVASSASGLFAAFTLALTCIGLFGQISLLVDRRYHEYGIRLALGASPWRNGMQVLFSLAKPLLIGFGIGVPLAFLLSSLIAPYLFGAAEATLHAIAASVLVLFGAGLAAALYPAWRATKADPLSLIRAAQ